MPKIIKLSNCEETTTINIYDWPLVQSYSWYKDSGGYAAAYIPKVYGPQRMHRILFNLQPGNKKEVDHKNGNRLDNRRKNLRVATRSQQAQNVAPQKNSISKYRGVYLDKRNGTWYAQVKHQGKKYYLGRFSAEKQAAKAASEFRKSIFAYSQESRFL